MMKRAVVAFLCVVGFAAPSAAVPGRVGYIVDGDTFSGIVKLDGDIEVSVRVRLRDIDTPEIHGECEYERQMAARARDKLAELIPPGSVVELSNIKDDKYLGRIDANVRNSRGVDVSAQMIRAGLARRYSGGKRKPWCGNRG